MTDFPDFPEFPDLPPVAQETVPVPADPKEIRKVCELIFASAKKTEELLAEVDKEKKFRSSQVRHLHDDLGVVKDLQVDGQVYAIARKADTFFLRRVDRNPVKV